MKKQTAPFIAQTICWLLLVAISLRMTPVFVVLCYEINKDYIAKNLCENRDKPAMGCNGRCQLTKSISHAMEEPQNTTDTKKETTPKDWFITTSEKNIRIDHVLLLIFFQEIIIEVKRSSSFFHPPNLYC